MNCNVKENLESMRELYVRRMYSTHIGKYISSDTIIGEENWWNVPKHADSVSHRLKPSPSPQFSSHLIAFSSTMLLDRVHLVSTVACYSRVFSSNQRYRDGQQQKLSQHHTKSIAGSHRKYRRFGNENERDDNSSSHKWHCGAIAAYSSLVLFLCPITISWIVDRASSSSSSSSLKLNSKIAYVISNFGAHSKSISGIVCLLARRSWSPKTCYSTTSQFIQDRSSDKSIELREREKNERARARYLDIVDPY